MNPTQNEHLILFRGGDFGTRLSPEDLQRALDETMAWFEKLETAGKVKAAQPLHHEGHAISGPEGSQVTDGPFAETKELILGYLALHACAADEALAIARSWPMLAYGGCVELRPIAPECPSFQRLRELRAHATV